MTDEEEWLNLHGHGDQECMCCQGGLTRSELRSRYAEMIDQHGWAIVGVIGERPEYYYTLGLSLHGFPELIAVDMDQYEAFYVLNHAGRLLRAGASVTDLGVRMDEEAGDFGQPRRPAWEFHQVDYSWLRSKVFAYAKEYWLTDKAPQTWQLVYCDDDGRMPWDQGYDQSIHQGNLFERRPSGISSI